MIVQDEHMWAAISRLSRAARRIQVSAEIDGDLYTISADMFHELRRALNGFDSICEQRDHEAQNEEE